MAAQVYPRWKSLRYSKDANDFLWWIVWKLRRIAARLRTEDRPVLDELRSHLLNELRDCDRLNTYDQRLRELEEEVRQLKKQNPR